MSCLSIAARRVLSPVQLLVAFAAAFLSSEAHAAPPRAKAARLLPQVQVFAPEIVRTIWPAAGRSVSAPVPRKVVVPGQAVAIAVVAEGEGRDALLQGSMFTYRILVDGKQTRVGTQPPVAVKRVKAEGAGAIVHSLGAAGLADAELKKVEGALTMVSVAAFVPDWAAPEVKARSVVKVEGEVTLPGGERIALAPAQFAVEAWAVAAAAPPFQDEASLQAWMNGYAVAPEPQHLGAALRIGARIGADPFAVVGFSSHAIEVAPPGAVPSVIAAMRGEDERARALGAIALRWAHEDGSALADTLSPEWRTRLESFPDRPQGYSLDPEPSNLGQTTQRMDLLWAEFMATGRPEPVRAIVDLLRFRDDYGAYVKARQTPGKDKTLTPAIARGVVYATAGWSLTSFTRSTPIVADYVARWQEDGTVSPVVREELRRLLVNEAFRPPKQAE